MLYQRSINTDQSSHVFRILQDPFISDLLKLHCVVLSKKLKLELELYYIQYEGGNKTHSEICLFVFFPHN